MLKGKEKTFSKLELIILIVCVMCDQIIKIVIDKNLRISQDVISNPIFEITKIYNEGVSFGILSGRTFFIILISLIAFYILIKIKANYDEKIINFAILLVMGGAIGNLIDRIIYGYVIDYIKLNFINFPIFNLADILITSGFILIIFGEIYKSVKGE